MAVQNGVASSMLLFPAAGSAGAQLRLGTASRWRLIREGVHARYGWWPEVTSSVDGFRPLAVQERIFRERYTIIPLAGRPSKVWDGQKYWLRPGQAAAAVPGTSNHGIGKTVDVANLGGLGQFGSTRYQQFADVAAEHGFSNAEGRSIGEPWHWSDTLNPDVPTGSDVPLPPPPPPAPIEEDDDMAGEGPAILAVVQNIENILARGGVTGAGTSGDVLTNQGLITTADKHVLSVADEVRAARVQIAQLSTQVDGIHAGTSIDVATLAKTLVDALDDDLAGAVADELAKRLAQ